MRLESHEDQMPIDMNKAARISCN